MRSGLLKSILGKYVCANFIIAFCHIDRVIIIEGNNAIATAIVKTCKGRILHWFIEAQWEISKNGTYHINNIKILKEDELDGYAGYTSQD